MRRIPQRAGVYVLANRKHTIIYIGRAEGGRLQGRIKDHVNDSKNKCIRKNAVYFRYVATQAYKSGERTLIKEYKAKYGKLPLCNTQDPSL
jgi:excinuclease UvrABC nuclease subunit